MDCVLTLPGLFPLFLFSPVFWWCFILNHLIKLTRNLWVGFGSLLLTCQTLLCLNERALILSGSMFFPFPLGGSLGQVVTVSLSAVLILPSDFTRSPEKMKMAAVIPGTLLERYTANMGVLVLNLKWGHAFVLNVSQFALITINFFTAWLCILKECHLLWSDTIERFAGEKM